MKRTSSSSSDNVDLQGDRVSKSESRSERIFRIEKEAVRAIKEEYKAEQERIIKEEDSHSSPNPWLTRTQWSMHLATFERPQLRGWIRLPEEGGEQGQQRRQGRQRQQKQQQQRQTSEVNEGQEVVEREDEEHGERRLQLICKAFRWMIRECQGTVDTVGSEALFVANRKEYGKTPTMGLSGWMDRGTAHKYSRVWEAVLCYFFRSQKVPKDERPAYQLTRKQVKARDKVYERVEEFEAWEAKQKESEGRSQNQSRNTRGNTSRTAKDKGWDSDEMIEEMAKVQQSVLELCIAILDHAWEEGEYDCVLISGLAVLGIEDDDSGWMSPIEYTPIYSAIIKLARLMVVQYAYDQRQEAIEELCVHGYSVAQAKTKASPLYFRVQEAMERFMILGQPGKRAAPIRWIYRMRTYGMKIRYTTTAEGRIQWIGKDTILYPKLRFNMGQLRGMMHGMTREMQQRLFQGLMMLPTMG